MRSIVLYLGLVLALCATSATHAQGFSTSKADRLKLVSNWSKLPNQTYSVFTVFSETRGGQTVGTHTQFQVMSGEGIDAFVEKRIKERNVACVEVLNKKHERLLIKFKNEGNKIACSQQLYMLSMFITSKTASH